MNKQKGVLTLLLIFISISLSAQSLSTLSDEELEIKKKEAIANENFELANEIKIEQATRVTIDEKLAQKNEELKLALEKEDFEKAEILKKEIAKLEADKEKLKELEEDRKIAIFQEKYMDVISIENQINNIIRGEIKQEAQVNNNLPIIQPTSNTTSLSTKSTTKTKLKKVNLEEVAFNDKVVGMFGVGFKSVKYDDGYYEDSESVISYHLANSRWWVNKYLAGGTFFDFTFGDYFDLSVGAQMTAFGDFGSTFLPYTSFGLGFGIDDLGDNYVPIIYKLGSNIFFKKDRSLGLIAELNLNLSNDYEYLPSYRIGLSWTRAKRKVRKQISN